MNWRTSDSTGPAAPGWGARQSWCWRVDKAALASRGHLLSLPAHKPPPLRPWALPYPHYHGRRLHTPWHGPGYGATMILHHCHGECLIGGDLPPMVRSLSCCAPT